MTMTIRPLHPLFVGEVSGLDLRQAITPEQASAVHAAMTQYAVLVFHEQNLSNEEQVQLTRSLGNIENKRGGNIPLKAEEARLPYEMNDVSNLGTNGKPLERDSRLRLFNLGNMLWHSDSSFRPIPAKYSLLSARVVNPVGGNTEFAYMPAAYDDLAASTKTEIDALICEHSLMYSRGSLGLSDFTDEERALFKPVRQALVRVHPGHGRKSLYLASHAGAIIGMTMPDARLLLRDLNEHATQPKYVYVHRWKLHDLIIWDNRQTMHRVRRYDDNYPRDMRRTTVAGEEMTTAQVS
jgi:alpha-ketoglutarate-dependent 2,4-dichlorophenoxyacetate dioxygenase